MLNKKRIIGLIIILLITALGCGIIYYITNEKYIKGEREYAKIKEDISIKKNENGKKKARYSFEQLKKKNSRAFGYIYLKDTKIDYPVVKSPKGDNNYYLHHSAFNSYSAYGSIFADYRCDYKSKNIILYGHHMDNGAMFGDLVKYKSQDFYRKHKEIEVWLKNDKYMCEVLSITEASPANDNIYKHSFASEEEYNLWVQEIVKRSMYKTEVANENNAKDIKNTITLSTCTNTNSNRFVVVARRK